MDRNFEKYLIEWKIEANRKPLIVRGARQIGKSYTINKFGRENFSNLVEINFELQPHLKSLFSNLNPEEIIKKLQITLNTNITPGSSLLFLDEIQECPQAVTALRYFYEKMPSLHVICAGSLLEFHIESENFKAPVGRIQYLYMYPMSFDEFLTALGETHLRDFLRGLNIKTEIPEPVHQKAVNLLKEYLIIGGMPAVTNMYISSKMSLAYQKEQNIILQTYRDDFGKYASRSKHVYLQKVFDTAPLLTAQNYKYANVDRDIPSRELKEALNLLTKAGVIHKIRVTSAHGLPLSIHSNENKFKILFLDTGLMQRVCGLNRETALTDDFTAINSGALAEQFAGQEFIAGSTPYEKANFYYWRREKKGSNAEVDYLINRNTDIIPVEIKSGATGHLKSLRLFMQEYKSKFGIRLSLLPMSYHDGIVSIPLYAAGYLDNIIKLSNLA